LIIAGHGEKETELKYLASQMNIQDYIYFLGLRMDVPEILKGADIFIYTSFYEGFPNAVLEAMAAGLPIITTDFAGVGELIDDNISGLIVPRDDDATAFEMIRQFCQNNAEYHNLGNNAKKKAFTNFTMPIMAAKTVDYYNKVIEGKV
jgi:glycosyltransferase involved in cell wall biosynthesis